MDFNTKFLLIVTIVCLLGSLNARYLLVEIKGKDRVDRNQEFIRNDALNKIISEVTDLIPNDSLNKIISEVKDLKDSHQEPPIESRKETCKSCGMCDTDNDCQPGQYCKYQYIFPPESVCDSCDVCAKDHGCLWESSMVRTSGGEQKMISDVKVGDSVLAVDERGLMIFSEVILQLHKDPEYTTEFQVIRTKTGRNLTLTPTHLIYKEDTDQADQDLKEFASSKPVFAKKITKGDFVFVYDEANGMIKDEVVSNDIESRKGISSPLTAYGTIIVEDILASCYSDYDHSFLHMAFAPVRWFYDVKNALSRMEWMENDDSSDYEHEIGGHHWYPETLVSIGKILFPEMRLDFLLRKD